VVVPWTTDLSGLIDPARSIPTAVQFVGDSQLWFAEIPPGFDRITIATAAPNGLDVGDHPPVYARPPW